MNEKLKKIMSEIKEYNNKGVIFVGGNSDGKTYAMKSIAKDLLLNKQHFGIFIPENCHGLDTELTVENTFPISYNEPKQPLSEDLIKNILKERLDLEQKQKEDKIAGIIGEELKKLYLNDKNNPIFKFFKDELKFSLIFEDQHRRMLANIELKRSNRKKSEEITSTGYKLMIRITSEIYFYLKILRETNSPIYIFIDEIDDKLHWEKRSIYFNRIFKFFNKQFGYLNIKFIISTNMFETVTNLPKKISAGENDINFKVVKFLDEEERDFQIYDSRDLITEQQVERIIFDKKETYIEEGEMHEKLKRIYFQCLKCNAFGCLYCSQRKDFEAIYKPALSIKEKIIHNSIRNFLRDKGW